MNNDDLNQTLGLLISIVALVISIIALVYTVLAYLLKSGHKIRCDISTTSTVECEDNYISSITLENLKDRATVIFDIYLKLGHSNYLLIESFANSPLILKPFEVYHKEYSPILFYSVNMYTIGLNKLFNSKEVKKRILLSTTDGKYVVKANTKHWRPELMFFKNHFTATIKPIRFLYKNTAYGSNVKFLLVLKRDDSEDAIIKLKDGDEELQIFKKCVFTTESLSSKEKLEKFIFDQINQENILCDSFEIIDFREIVNEMKANYTVKDFELESLSFWNYYVLGKILTIWEDHKLRKENKRQSAKYSNSKTK